MPVRGTKLVEQPKAGAVELCLQKPQAVLVNSKRFGADVRAPWLAIVAEGLGPKGMEYTSTRIAEDKALGCTVML